MILVNNPGSWQAVYAPLRHAKWDGLTFADLVFPFFLWIMGVSLALSGTATGPSSMRILRRSAVLFAIGLGFNFIPDLDPGSVRIPGVLQRIALCYLAAAFLHKGGFRWEFVGLAGCFLVYSVVMLALPISGAEPGRLDVDGNAARAVDQWALGGHLWSVTKTWDPEGIVSTLTAVATTILGLFAGRSLRAAASRRTAFVLIVAGVVGVIASWALGFLFPVNKNLWSPSYVLVTAGLAAVLLALGILFETRAAFDPRMGGPAFRSFAAQGKNPLLLYVLSVCIGKIMAYGKTAEVPLREWAYRFLCKYLSAFDASLTYALLLVIVFAVIGLVLEKRGVALRL